eukprot:GFUD01058585.1.p1 GENE.GFUD01058585.1~~GFUD01058585.1.p1  ORF type:complete len:187 (-),score=72.59 GFUD01058585.1:576-1136(-)
MSSRALVLLATGAEEMETVITVDMLRRGGVEVVVAGVDGETPVTCSRSVKIVPDISLATAATQGPYDCIVLPGGGPGAAALCASVEVGKLLQEQDEAGRLVAAICAAPTALLSHKIGLGKRVTCYPAPAFIEKLAGSYTYVEEKVVVDGNIVTSRGPGTTFDFGLELVKIMVGKEKMVEIASAMLL